MQKGTWAGWRPSCMNTHYNHSFPTPTPQRHAFISGEDVTSLNLLEEILQLSSSNISIHSWSLICYRICFVKILVFFGLSYHDSCRGDFNLNNFQDGVLSSAFMVGLLVASPIFASLSKRWTPSIVHELLSSSWYKFLTIMSRQ